MKSTKLAALKKLSLALVLACGVNSAYADYTYQATGLIQNNPITFLPSTDLFLTVWDPVAKDSYAVDMGVDIHTFEAQALTSNITFNLDSQFTTFAATGNALTYNVAGLDQSRVVSSGILLDTVLESYPADNSPFGTGFNGRNLTGLQANIKGYLTLNNGNTSEILSSTNPAYFDSVFWGVGQGASGVNSAVAGGVGANHLSLMWLNTPGTTLSNSTLLTETLPAGYFSLSTANNTLVWTANTVSAVPLPGAVWLFLGGILTLLGSQKRKSA